MSKREAKCDKAIQFNEIIKKIEKGELEVVHFDGISEAWKIFNKIRVVKEPTKYVDYVRCKTCKEIRTFKPQNGPSSLAKHNCKNKNQNEEDMVFKDIPAEKACEIQKILLQKSIEFCSQDIISPEIFSGSGFLKYAQFLTFIGSKEGCINLLDLLPKKTVICRYIQTFKEEEEQTIVRDFKESIKNNYCSLTMNSNTTIDGEIKLTVSFFYFDTDLTELTKKVLFTVSVDESAKKTMSYVVSNLKTFGCDERALKTINVVRHKNETFNKILEKMCLTNECVASVISSILQPFLDNNEVGKILFTCKAIVSHLIETEKNMKLSFVVVVDNGTWKSKLEMIQQINTHYNEVMNLLGDEKENELKYNKKVADDLVTVLQPFIEAIDSLHSTTGPTLNKVLPEWSLLKDHLHSGDKYSIDIKRSMKLAAHLFEVKFTPTMEQKVACFLDPRFRPLKMIPADERDDVILEIRRLLDDMPAVPANAAAEIPNPPAKKGKFSHLEADDDDIEERDEVSTYIHSTQLKKYNLKDSDFNIIGIFWNDDKEKLPKLFRLATTRLHIPACCCSCGYTLNIKKKLTTRFAVIFSSFKINCRILEISLNEFFVMHPQRLPVIWI